MDSDAIFAAVGRTSAYVLLQDKRAEKAKQLRSVQDKRCGNCGFWMTRGCAPEKKHGQFKSCNSIACKDFTLSDVGGLIQKFTEELEKLDKKLAAFVGANGRE